jgi:hypothetical protein
MGIFSCRIVLLLDEEFEARRKNDKLRDQYASQN